MTAIDIWKFLAGLGLFLYGLSLMEYVVKHLAGRPFKLFLRRFTTNPVSAIIVGAIITALLQSSSVVALMVLAFTGAGVISFRNALCIIMGSNLGTTLTGWIVATAGFKLNIESWSFPFIAVTSILMFFTQRRDKLYNTFSIVFSLGILFLGLGFMKDGADHIVAYFNPGAFKTQGTFFYVIIGFIVTTIIQSSSATMAIALTALNANAISFASAAALVIGSEVGTTIKVLIGGLKGNGDKKRTAWGNFIFNIVTAILSVIFLQWLLNFVQEIAGIRDPLIGLVFFQSFINFLAIIIFLPFINPFAEWLEKKFRGDDYSFQSYIRNELPVVQELAVRALEQEALSLLQKVADFHKKVLHLTIPQHQAGFMDTLRSYTRKSGTTNIEYNRIKETEGDILEYYVRLRKHELNKPDYEKVIQLTDAVRQSVYAAKCIKDIRHNFEEFQNSANNILYQQYGQLRNNWLAFDTSFRQLVMISDKMLLVQELTKAMTKAFQQQDERTKEFVSFLMERQVEELEASSFMNVQREMLSSKKAMLRALADIRLGTPESDAFKYSPFHKTNW